MKKLLDLDAHGEARVHQATTWSFYFEGERFFEGTRSLFTAAEVEKPVLNAYRMLARLGDTRLAVHCSHAWSLDRLDEGEAGMPEEVDALATSHREGGVRVLVWRHADDQYAGEARVRQLRIDGRHSNSHAVWQALGRPLDPSEPELQAIKARQGLEPIGPERTEPIRDGVLILQISLPLPSVSLLEIRPSA